MNLKAPEGIFLMGIYEERRSTVGSSARSGLARELVRYSTHDVKRMHAMLTMDEYNGIASDHNINLVKSRRRLYRNRGVHARLQVSHAQDATFANISPSTKLEVKKIPLDKEFAFIVARHLPTVCGGAFFALGAIAVRDVGSSSFLQAVPLIFAAVMFLGLLGLSLKLRRLALRKWDREK